MTAGEMIIAANEIAAAAGCAVEDDEEREIELLNLCAAELWGLSGSVREAKGLERIDYGGDVRVSSPEDEMKTEEEIYPALSYYLASALVMPDAPIMGSLLRERGNEAICHIRLSVAPSVGRIREVYMI